MIKVTKTSELINVETVVQAKDKRGGYLVKFARTSMRGNSASTAWKEVRLLDGKFENWPKRWGTGGIQAFQVQALKLIEANVAALSAGKRVEARSQKTDSDYLIRDVHALDAQRRT